MVGLLLVGALVMTACTSGGSKGASGFRIATVMRGTIAAGTARFVGTDTFYFSHLEPSVSRTRGEVDYRHGSSSSVTRIRDHGKTTVSRSLTIGKFLYLSPDTFPGVPEQLGGFTPPSAGRRWTRTPFDTGSSNFQLGDIGDVSALATALERDGGHAERLGVAKVRGVETEHDRFTIPPSEIPAEVKVMRSVLPDTRTFDLWVDAHHRLRRLDRSSDETGDHSTSRYEFFDFGAPVVITTPPADQVAVDNSTELIGSWKLIHRGRADGTTWRVYEAPTRSGECWSTETKPRDPIASTAPKQHGRPVQECWGHPVAAGSAPVLPGEDLDAASSSLPNGMALLYGRVTPKARRVTLRLRGGGTKTLVPTGRTFVVALASDEVVSTIVLHGATKTIRCPLARSGAGYQCSESLEPQPAPSQPPSIELPPPETATPGPTVDVAPPPVPPSH